MNEEHGTIRHSCLYTKDIRVKSFCGNISKLCRLGELTLNFCSSLVTRTEQRSWYLEQVNPLVGWHEELYFDCSVIRCL